jgi:hypothetical protein
MQSRIEENERSAEWEEWRNKAIAVVVGVFLLGGCIALSTQQDEAPSRPEVFVPSVYAPDNGASDLGGTSFDPDYSDHIGYENPAAGDDGSFDCAPGGGPVFVGSSDPAGLDGDGDGIGCE